MTVQPCPHGRSTQGHLAQGCLSLCDPLNTELNLTRIAAEFLSQANRRGILEVRPSNLDDLVELLRFVLQCLVQSSQCGKKLVLHHLRRGDMNGRRNHIVTRLAEIDMVVRMHQLAASRTTEQLRGTI